MRAAGVSPTTPVVRAHVSAVEIMLVSSATPMAVAERLARREWAGRAMQIHSAQGFAQTLLSESRRRCCRAGGPRCCTSMGCGRFGECEMSERTR